jgi:hypothetical protein
LFIAESAICEYILNINNAQFTRYLKWLYRVNWATKHFSKGLKMAEEKKDEKDEGLPPEAIERIAKVVDDRLNTRFPVKEEPTWKKRLRELKIID